jgi:hypothetical protein
VQRLGYVAVNAIDPDKLVHDVVDIVGARIVERDEQSIMLSSNRRHVEYIIRKADENSLAVCGLEAVSAAAVDEVEARCKAAGLEVLSTRPSLPCIEKSVTFATSEGHIFEVHTAMAQGRPARYQGPGAHPRCLDHVNFTAADPKTWTEEMQAACGFLLSERTTGYELSWMRAADGRHHTVAVVKSHTGGLHHVSWEFNSFEDFKNLGDALTPESRRLTWGPGRHGAGDNLFLYFKDSADFLVECIAEMEVIHDDDAAPRVVEPGENLSNWKVVNQWGALPPIEWVEHFSSLAKRPALAAN